VKYLDAICHNAERREALKAVILAWEALPPGNNYPIDLIQAWLDKHMKPAIEKARKATKESSMIGKRCHCGFESGEWREIPTHGEGDLDAYFKAVAQRDQTKWIAFGGWWACPVCGAYYIRFGWDLA
jgi:hypothetical protein